MGSKKCTDCSFHDGCYSNLIDSTGPGKASIMVVIDTPGATDDERNELLTGDGGSKFDYLLDKAGINRDEIHITSAIRCRPSWGKTVKKEHMDACFQHLVEEIMAVRPKVIIAMGDVAMQMLIQQKGITSFRGFFEPFEVEYEVGSKMKVFRTQILPTFAPTSALTKWEYDNIILHDLKKAKLFIRKKELPKEPELKWEIVTDLKRLEEVVQILENSPFFTFDTETTGFLFHRHEIIMVGFCPKPGVAYCIPFRKYKPEETKKWWAREDMAADREMVETINKFVGKNKSKIKSALKRVFRSRAKKSAHNSKFDTNFVRHHICAVRNLTFDTVIAHALVDENMPHNLTFCLDWYGIHYGNYESELWEFVNKTSSSKKPYSYIPPLKLGLYLAKDSDGAHRLKIKVAKDLVREGMVKLFKKQQMPLVKLMADLEYNGMKLDVKRLQKISHDFAGMLADIDKQLKKLTKDDKFNPNSPQQLQNYLLEIGALGNDGDKKTKGGGFSTDESVLSKLSMSKRYGKVPRLILESRSMGKLKSNYLDGKDGKSGMLHFADKNNFIHYSSNIHTPRTGRMSVDNPAMQTIPRPNPKYPEANIRQLFITSQPDYLIWSVDFAQLEMRIAAFLSGDPVMIKEIQQGVDMHSRNAVTLGTRVGMLPRGTTEEEFLNVIKYKAPDGWQKLKGKKLERVEDKIHQCAVWSELRTLTKSLGFGLNYGMNASTLAKDHDRDEDEMQDMIDAYFDKYEGLYIWRQQQCDAAIDEGLLVLPETGRKRRFHAASDWFNSEYSQNIRMREMDMEGIHRQGMNFPIQGYANEIFTKGKLKLYRQIRKEQLDARLMLSMHDGILGEAHRRALARVKELAHSCLERKLGKGKFEVPLTVDFDIYDRWSGKKFALEDVG